LGSADREKLERHRSLVRDLEAAWGADDLVGPADERLYINVMHAMGMTNRSSFGLEQVDIGSRTISLRDPLPRLT
jgi:hypothetical protein